MQNQNSIYALRGPRVMPLAIEDIHFWASHTAKKLEIKKAHESTWISLWNN